MLKRDHRVVPLYYQVEHVIRQRIITGEYPPGSQIPSENELSHEMGVSRVTVREALRELVRENMLVKVQGKGTFVAQHPTTRLPALIASTTGSDSGPELPMQVVQPYPTRLKPSASSDFINPAFSR